MDYKLPDNYDPTRKQYHILCPICDDYFWGRKNKLYHPWCKVIYNNHKDQLFRNAIKEESHQLKNTYKVLKSFSRYCYMDRSVSLSLLEHQGLNLAYAIKQQSDIDSEVYTICGYNLKIIENKNKRKAIITKA